MAAAPPACMLALNAPNDWNGVPRPQSPKRLKYCRLCSSVAEVAEE